MRVLQIINSLGTGGAEKLLLETIPLYQKQGVEMDLLVLWDNDFPFLQELRKTTQGKIYILSQSQNIKDVYSLSHIAKIRRIIKEYDIIHVHLFPAQYFVAVANIGLGKKLVFTEHSTSNKRLSNSLFKYLDKIVYSSYRSIIAISDDVVAVLNKHIPNRSEIVIKIENGVNINAITRAKAYLKADLHPTFTDTNFIICQVSAFRVGKDQITLVKALSLLPHHYKLILVGTGDDNEINRVKFLISQLNLSNRVFLLGNRTDVNSIIKTTDVNVLSSEWEGLSLASVEGMASGKPFIASDVPGLKDIVGGAGILFPLGDERALADSILKLSEDEALYKSTVDKCQERASHFDINVMVDKHIALYRSLYEKN